MGAEAMLKRETGKYPAKRQVRRGSYSKLFLLNNTRQIAYLRLLNHPLFRMLLCLHCDHQLASAQTVPDVPRSRDLDERSRSQLQQWI